MVFILGSLTVGLVYLDLNTDVCMNWMHKNLSVSSHVHTVQSVGTPVKLLPLFSWFPASVAMLLGFRKFKQNYLVNLFFCALMPGSSTCVYRIVMSGKLINVVYFNFLTCLDAATPRLCFQTLFEHEVLPIISTLNAG